MLVGVGSKDAPQGTGVKAKKPVIAARCMTHSNPYEKFHLQYSLFREDAKLVVNSPPVGKMSHIVDRVGDASCAAEVWKAASKIE